MSIDYANVFEWICLKRFQEIFATHQKPSLVLPLFFDTPVFGNLSELSFCDVTCRLPKITENSKKASDLDQLTASPNDWKNLVSEIDSKGNICIKARQMSASSDAFLIADATLKSKSVIVTVALAVKNYTTTQFSHRDLQDECDLFNRMFLGINCEERKNILVICCTNYDERIASNFNGKFFQVYTDLKYGNIHEVIILDLTNPQNRASFFNGESHQIERVIAKPEVEFNGNK